MPPASFTVVNNTTIQAVTSGHAAGLVEVQVTNPDQQRGIKLNAFTFDPIPAPFITAVSPNSGPSSGGTQLTINGGDFVAGATVLVGGAAATGVTLVNASQITAATPGGSGTVDIQVRNPDGQIATLGGSFTYVLVAPPTTSSVSPNFGPAAGGTSVTITGTGFVAGAAVIFGGAAAPAVNVVSPTQITATTPAHAPGLVSVVVRNPDNQTGTLTNGFRYDSPPAISGVSPVSGPATGGTTVTISGTNFQAGATVRFAGILASSVVVSSATQIQAVTASGPAGPATVTVTNPNGQSASLNNGFTFTAPLPTISGVAPALGPLAGSVTVTITGTGFQPGATVLFGGLAATSVTVSSATQIQAVAPARTTPGSVDVQVINPDLGSTVRANAFTYVAPPAVLSIAPNIGSTAGGTAVLITGTNFQSGATVTLGPNAATGVLVTSATTILATTPAGAAGTVNVTVRNPDGQSGVLANGFTYAGIPVVTGVTPNNGPNTGGTSVTIAGTGFLSGATVRFGANPASSVVFNSSTSLTAVTPAGSVGLVDVTVINPGGQSGTLTAGFSYTPAPPPAVTSVSPNFGPAAGGTLVTISGSNFQAGALVTFGGASATSVTVLSSTQIRALTPAGALGPVSVQVSNPDLQTGTLAGGFNYVPPPTVTGVSPATGFASGGAIVTVMGTGFQNGATVDFGGVNPPSVVFVSATQLSVTTPAHAAGAVAVRVTNPDGQSFTLNSAFTYLLDPAPVVTAVNPNSGPATATAAGPTQVTVSGSNFRAGATVLFGSTAGTVTGVTSTQIAVNAPAHAPGTVNVDVRNSDGQSGSLPNSFTFIAPPVITSIAPNSGPTAGGTAVVITGSGFLTGALVLFGSLSGSSVVVLGPTQIQAVTPASPSGTVAVSVVNPDMQAATLSGAYTFASPFPAPTITAISPNTGPDGGGTGVTISGTNFQAGATVSFGGAAAAVGSVAASQIVATTAPHAAGQVAVMVNNPDGQSASLANGYAYLLTAVPGVRRPTPPTPPAPVDPAIIPPPDTTGYATLTVCGSGCMFSSIQAAVNAATCSPNGTIIALRAGETFNLTGEIALPNKSCAPGKWIVIRTDAPDSSLPPPGTRIDPSVHAASMPRIVISQQNQGVFFVQHSAQRYRFLGLELTTSSTSSGNSADLIALGDGNFGGPQNTVARVPQELVVDRCWIHGNATSAAPRGGVSMHCGQCAVLDSRIEEIHNVGFDSSAVRGWNATGPILVRNNFLSGAGETVFFGGADTNITNNIPSDITIERNHIFKPLTWRIGHSSYLGVPWQIKNNIEFKMGQRILIEGNVIENNWQHAQAGAALNLKSENQSGNNPWIQTADVTVRYNIFLRIDGGPVEVGGSAGIFPDINLARVSIHDNLFDEQGAISGGRYLLLGGGDVTAFSFTHNTLVPSGPSRSSFSTMVFDNDVPVGSQPFPGGAAIHDNIFPTAPTTFASGTSENCAIGGMEAAWQCFDDPRGTPNGEDSWHRNLVFHTNPTSTWCRSDRPFSSLSPFARNKAACVNSINEVGFVDVVSKNYRLLSSSPGKGRATDGRDVGADIDMIEAKTAGVK